MSINYNNVFFKPEGFPINAKQETNTLKKDSTEPISSAENRMQNVTYAENRTVDSIKAEIEKIRQSHSSGQEIFTPQVEQYLHTVRLGNRDQRENSLRVLRSQRSLFEPTSKARVQFNKLLGKLDCLHGTLCTQEKDIKIHNLAPQIAKQLDQIDDESHVEIRDLYNNFNQNILDFNLAAETMNAGDRKKFLSTIRAQQPSFQSIDPQRLNEFNEIVSLLEKLDDQLSLKEKEGITLSESTDRTDVQKQVLKQEILPSLDQGIEGDCKQYNKSLQKLAPNIWVRLNSAGPLPSLQEMNELIDELPSASVQKQVKPLILANLAHRVLRQNKDILTTARQITSDGTEITSDGTEITSDGTDNNFYYFKRLPGRDEWYTSFRPYDELNSLGRPEYSYIIKYLQKIDQAVTSLVSNVFSKKFDEEFQFLSAQDVLYRRATKSVDAFLKDLKLNNMKKSFLEKNDTPVKCQLSQIYQTYVAQIVGHDPMKPFEVL